MKFFTLEILLITLLFAFNVHSRSIYKRINSDIGDGKNIDYGTSRKLDVYFDEDTIDQLKPVVIHVHGGGWFAGSKEEFKNMGPILTERGYVAVLPGYILFPNGKLEDMVNDVYQAFVWTYNNIQKYGGDPNNITVSAHSAGSHLAALTVFKSAFGIPNNGEPLEPLSFIKKLVLFNGPYDFDNYSILKQLFKVNLENGISEQFMTNLFKSENISPTDIIKKFDDDSIDASLLPRFVFIHTSLDIVVPKSSTEDLVNQLNRVIKNPDIKYEFYRGYGHATIFNGLKNNEKKFKDLYISLIQS